MTQILTDSLTVIALAVIVGWAFRRSPVRDVAIVMTILPGLTLISQLQNNFAAYNSTQLIAGAQGRYLFMAIIPLLVLSAIGWRNLMPRFEDRVRFGRIALWAFPLIGAYGFSVAYRGFYENTHLQVTTDGLGRLVNLSAAGQLGFGALAALAVVSVVWAAFEIRRQTTAAPGPLQSQIDPTPTATQRNQTT